jgi:hypothetical protein
MLKRDWGRVAKQADSQGRYRCSKCREWKEAAQFNKNRSQKSGLHYMCRSCANVHVREYNLPAKYGITAAKFAEMLLAQGGKCACCGGAFSMEGRKTERPCVDHNHKTGAVRALLCGRCNLAAGNVLDSSERAIQLSKYLSAWDC